MLSLLKSNVVVQIACGIVLGIILGIVHPFTGMSVGILGEIFIGALRAIAPILVFILVMSAIANQQIGTKTNIKFILLLYAVGTFSAALLAVILSYFFPIELTLSVSAENVSPPQNVIDVLKHIVISAVDNPVNALLKGNYLGILTWSVGLGITFRHGSENSRAFLADLAHGVTQLVGWVIRCAPFGIFGLVAYTVSTTGIESLQTHLRLINLLVIAMLLVALVINPLIVFIVTRRNPYPLVLTCLRESGVTAFFTRSSAANIPVNLNLCRRLNLNEETYAVSIPLGATINMAGAAITITIMTLAAVHTLNIPVDFITALILSVFASICACGASGVAGGSLLLIPLACSLFGISNEVAMQVVGIGFIIGVVQDSCETALNSSTDVLFTAAAEKSKSAMIAPQSLSS